MKKIITTSTNSLKVAKNISKALLEKKLSPCIQIVDKILSEYMWRGEICSQIEFLVLIKCNSSDIKDITKSIKELHNYDIPEIIETDMKILDPDYQKWFNDSLM